MTRDNRKYIFVVGGVISGVGKGITVSSISKILQDRGLKVTAIKIDPYINTDAGTMNPTEHGEVFVLDDGDETDQDMGNYERFLDISLTRANYMTTGRVYQEVINHERNLDYGGKCVEVIPHIPLEIIRRIKEAGRGVRADVVVIEVGGTVGEYQNILFMEAARIMKIELPGQVFFTMVSYVPIPSKVGEMKTKPTQHAVRTLNASGLQPDIIIARSERPLDEKRKEKLSFFCNIPKEHIISAPDVDSIYDVPLNFEKERLGTVLCHLLHIKNGKRISPRFAEWKKFVRKVHRARAEVKIAVIGKYFDTGDFILSDSYISVIEAIKHSAYHLNRRPLLSWLNALDFEKSPDRLKELSQYDGIIIPGGFGGRGIEGKIAAIRYAREHKIPYFGLCYGMQLAIVEYARNVLKLKDAHTTEINPKTSHPVIAVMESQKQNLINARYGGSMRLGAYLAVLKDKTIARIAYNTRTISERHRHRYEVNPEYIERLEKAGLVFSGRSPDGKLMEIAELPRTEHPFFLGTQFHPEFKSHPLAPHPLFSAFIKSAIIKTKKKK